MHRAELAREVQLCIALHDVRRALAWRQGLRAQIGEKQ
jgi:hypothetical protein